MKVLVTGSSGFIGSHVVERLRAENYTVLGTDHRPPASTEPPSRFQLCDLLDRDRLAAIFASFAPDYVLHIGGRTDLYEKKDLRGYAANIEGVENLMHAIKASGTVRRCLYTSSQMVCRTGYVPSSDTDFCPHTVYGESKVKSERMVREQDGAGVEWCLVRPTTVWGPGVSEHYRRFLRMIQTGRYFHIGHRPLYKSFSYVRNIAFQYQRIMEAPVEQVHRKVFYLADYDLLSMRDWTNSIQRELGGPPIRTLPESLAKMAARLGDLVNAIGFVKFPFNSFRLKNVLTEYIFDLAPTQLVCGTLPWTAADGVKEMVAWFKAAEKKSPAPAGVPEPVMRA